MDNERNEPDNISDIERAKAWIITLILGIAVCLGLIIYTLITRNPALNFLDSTFFKPGLVWLGFIGLFLVFTAYLLFTISTSIFKFLPDNRCWVNITAIIGIFLLLTAFVLQFISYDIEHRFLFYLGYTLEMSGTCIVFLKELIQYKFNRIANFCNLMGTLMLFAGILTFAFAY